MPLCCGHDAIITEKKGRAGGGRGDTDNPCDEHDEKQRATPIHIYTTTQKQVSVVESHAHTAHRENSTK